MLDSEFRQRIVAASRGPVDPELYSHIFADDVSADQVDEEGVFTPESPEGYEAILAMLGDETLPAPPLSDDAALDAARSLGFNVEDES